MARAEGILRLLIVDDSLTGADTVINALRSAGHAVRASREHTLAEIEKALTNHTWDLLICSDSMENPRPAEIMNLIHGLAKDIPCIVLASDKASEEKLFTCGAYDVVLQADIKRLQFAVERELTNVFNRRLARRNERALRESEKRSHALLESSRDAVAYMHEGMHIYVNSAYLILFGYEEAEDIDGLPFLDMVSVDDHGRFKSVFRQFSESADTSAPETVTVQCVKADGESFKANIEFSHARVEGEDCTQVVIRDEVIAAGTDAQLQLLRDHDFLSGLYSRVRFLEELEQVMHAAAEGKGDAVLLYIVLDDFQVIKERVGLGISDVIIKSVADLLRKNLVAGEVLGHFSDRVFTVIVPTNDNDKVDARAESYRKSVDDYVSHIDGSVIDLHCSIGISYINESFSSAETVLENADRACVQAQHAGGNRLERYHPTEQQKVVTTQSPSEWKTKLEKALQNDEFCLYYQPIVSLHGEEQEIYDVLLRVKQPDGSLLPPDHFIEHATEVNMMGEIDKWVIRKAFDALATHRVKYPKTRFFIKLSEQTLCTREYVDWLCVTLNAHNLDGSAMVFEISETSALENLEQTKAVISQLKNIGCEFGLEHFGSGIDFSQSLSELDVDYLKINGHFVQNMAKDKENQAAVKAIIEMTKQAGKRCIAEFVSDANSLALLWRLGVDYAQGYYIHEPSEKLDYNFEDDDL
ncbi:MAG: two-component system response regulator [Gammaproteobacteria bacterium]|nr:MAG: two-component system response regulator [Gammaproteobacteria bacterium]